MIKSNYDKYPYTRIDGEAVTGWEEIVSALEAQWSGEPVWAARHILPGMMEEFARPVGTFSGQLMPSLQSEVYNFEDPEQRAAFLEDKDVYVDVPHTDKKVLYCAQRKVAVTVSALGASKAINLGAYNFAINQIGK